MSQPSRDSYLKIVRRHYPSVRKRDIEDFEGNDHVVLVVHGKKAFRFPKTQRDITPARSTLLRELQPMATLPLPLIDIHRDNETGISYEINDFIPGVSFDPSIARMFSRREMTIIARQLGAFLDAVHSFPLNRARELGIDEMNPDDFGDYMESHPNAFPKLKALVYPHLSARERAWADDLFGSYITHLRRQPFETRVTHSDMWTDHIIVSPGDHTLAGVIDFWGRIADPSNDFKAFEHYGKDFVSEVYRHYALPVDDDFEMRRLFYTSHDEMFTLARALERDADEATIDDCKRSLSQFIETHPSA